MKKQQALAIITLTLLCTILCAASIQTQVKAAPSPPKPSDTVTVTMSVTDINGNPVEEMSRIPISTTVYVWGSYKESSGRAGTINVTVCYSSTNPYHWSAPTILFPTTTENSPFGSADNQVYLTDYQFKQPGYYLFTLTGVALNNVSNRITDTVSVTAGPVLSEPATLGALALCFVALGAVFFQKKKPAKQ